jgi:hypothetical protein
LSHRFIRFELPDAVKSEGIAKVDEFIKQMYKEEGTGYHKLQEDTDLMGENGQIASSSQGKHGKFYTL